METTPGPMSFLYEDGFGTFLLISLIMGGAGAYLSGRAIASTWRAWWHVGAYMLVLAGAIRFIHFALFQQTMLSLHYYLIDLAVCLLFGYLGFRVTRAAQMARQYGFAFHRAGFLRWQARKHAPPA